MFPFSSASLRVRLILLVLLSLLPGLGFTLSHSREDRHQLRADALAETQELTRQAASNQNQMIQGTRQLLVALAQLPQVRREESAQCGVLFAKLLKQYPIYANLGAVDRNGEWFCSALPVKKPLNPADRAWLQLAMRHQSFAVGNYQVGHITGKSTVNLAYPVFDDEGKVQAIVVAVLGLEQFTKIAATAQLPPGATVMVFDRNGTILSQYPQPDKRLNQSLPESPVIQSILKQKKGIAELSDAAGVSRLYAFTQLSAVNHDSSRDNLHSLLTNDSPQLITDQTLYITIGIPKSVIFAQADQALIHNLTGLGLAGLLILAVAWFSSDLFILRQVNALLKSTRRLAKGELSVRTDIAENPGELNQLARAFNEMAASVEVRVQERTAQLTHANQQLQQEISVRVAAEINLRESEERYRRLVELSPDAIIVHSEGKIAYINSAGIKLLGATSHEELIGTSVLDIVHTNSRETVKKRIEKLQEQGAQVPLTEILMVRVDGQIIATETTGVQIVYNGKPAVQVVVRDITKRKQFQAELEAQAQLLELAHDTILVRDVSNRIIFWNQGAVEMYGYSRQEALQQHSHTFLQTEFPQPLEDIEAQILQSGRWEGEIVHTRRDGSRLVVASRWGLLRDEYGIPVKILEINYDITERKRAEQELRQSETLIRTLYQVATDPQLNLQERFQKVLAIGCQHFNLDFGFLARVEGERYEVLAVQTPDDSVMVGDVFDVKQSYCQETLKRAEPLYIDHASASNWCCHPGYAGFHMETYVGMRVMVNNSVYGVLCFCSHVPSQRSFNSVDQELLKLMTQWIGNRIERYTAAKALERLQHQNELILNSAGEGICGVNSQGNITFVNPTAAKMLGYEVKALINHPIHTMLCQPVGAQDCAPCTSWPLEKTFLYPVLKDGTAQYVKDQVFIRQDGSSFSAECIATPIVDFELPILGTEWGSASPSAETIPAKASLAHQKSIVGAVLTFSDITERLVIERMKDEFISVVSHELRTPLTSIRGALGLIAGGLLTTQPQKAQRMLEIAAANTDRLTRLINDILDIERMESGKAQLEKQACQVHELMVETVDELRAMAEKAGITLKIAPIDAQLWVDRDRVIQVLTNLIGNAIKFSPSSTTIEISAEFPEETERGKTSPAHGLNPTVLFKVKDQGRGIPPEQVESIFGRFQQVNASDSRDQGGTGLGLTICRSIVQQHGGRIWVESQLGKGSTFYFTLPALKRTRGTLGTNSIGHSEERIALDSPLPQLTEQPVQNSPLILLCDDDTSTHTLLQIMLEQCGYRVRAVASGQEAIQQAILLQPAVILLDLVMPDMNGWETMAGLKEQPTTKNIPIIIFSALSPPNESSYPDVVGWLPKPVTELSLYEIIEQSLKHRAKVTRVLVVEDDLDLAGVLKTTFERHGIAVYHAQTGWEAISLSQHILPNLVLLDLGLPEGDGYMVVEWLRLHQHLHEVPLVVYSAKELNEAERERLVLGPTEFFTKGRINPDDFENRVIALLKQIVAQSETKD